MVFFCIGVFDFLLEGVGGLWGVGGVFLLCFVLIILFLFTWVEEETARPHPQLSLAQLGGAMLVHHVLNEMFSGGSRNFITWGAVKTLSHTQTHIDVFVVKVESIVNTVC